MCGYMDALDRDRIDENERIPREVLDELKRMGLFGVSLPREFGGMGLSPLVRARLRVHHGV